MNSPGVSRTEQAGMRGMAMKVRQEMDLVSPLLLQLQADASAVFIRALLGKGCLCEVTCALMVRLGL